MAGTSQFNLVRAELQELVDQVIDPDAPEAFGTYVFASSDPGAELARALEREVFGEFFGNSPELLAAEYGAYEEASIFFCVIDHRRRLPAGAMRVIVPSDAGHKSLDDLDSVWGEPADEVLERSRVGFGRDQAWDVATLAVSDEYRGEKTNGLVSLALYQALAHSASICGPAWWVSVLDVIVLDLIQSNFQRPFSYFRGVGPMRYLDSASSVPVWCDIAAWMERLAAADPTMYELLVEGNGLEGAVSRPNWDRLTEVVPSRTSLTTAS